MTARPFPSAYQYCRREVGFSEKCPTDAFWPTVHFSTNAVLLAECDKRVAGEFSIRRLHADARGPPRDFPNSLLEPLPAPHRRNVLRKLLSGLQPPQ